MAVPKVKAKRKVKQTVVKTKVRNLTRREFVKGAVGAAVVASVPAFLHHRALAQTVNVGVLWSSTGVGELSKYDTLIEGKTVSIDPMAEFKNGIDYAARLVNEDQGDAVKFPKMATFAGIPGLGNAKLNLEYLDYKGDVTAAAKAVSDNAGKVACFLGIGDHRVIAAASEAAEKAGKPFFTPSAIESYLTKRNLKTFFRLPPNDLETVRIVLETLHDRLGKDETVIPTRYLWVTRERPQIADDISKVQAVIAEKKLGGEGDKRFTLDGVIAKPTDTAAQIVAAIKAARAIDETTGLFLDVEAPVLEAVMREFGQLAPMKRPALLFVDPYLGRTERLRLALSGAADQPLQKGWRWLFTNLLFLKGVWDADADFAPAMGRLRTHYKDTTGSEFSAYSMMGLTGVQAVTMALDAAKSTDASAIIDATRNKLEVPIQDLAVPWFGIKFKTRDGKEVTARGDLGQNTEALTLIARRDENGNFMLVELPGGITPSGIYIARRITIIVVNLLCLNINCGF